MKSTVLIVDDQESMRSALKGMLKEQGYNLFFANDGQKALKQAKEILPDLILLDVMMPDMDGFEVCKHLRNNSILAKVPIIMVTALDDHESKLRGIEAGADDFISKPYNIFELRARVRTITNLNRYHRLITEQTKFKWIIENTSEAYLLLDDKKQIIYANTKARLYLSCSQEGDIDDTFIQLIAKTYNQVHEPSASPSPVNIELDKIPKYIVRPDTETALPFWLRIEVMEMLEKSGKNYLIHLHNVTDSILMDRQKWVFNGQIGHKLRTPLMPIIGGIDFLLEHLPNLSTDKIKDLLEMAYEGSTRLNSQIEEILSYIRISSTIQTVYEPCNITDILSSINIAKDLLDIELVKIILPDVFDNCYLHVARQTLEIILLEIFSNAKKFHPKENPKLEIELVKQGEMMVIQITDDGINLLPDQLVSIWMPYYQCEKYFTGETKGMGLGLSMIASLILEANGTYTAYNCIDKNGLVIKFTLPIYTGSGKNI